MALPKTRAAVLRARVKCSWRVCGRVRFGRDFLSVEKAIWKMILLVREFLKVEKEKLEIGGCNERRKS